MRLAETFVLIVGLGTLAMAAMRSYEQMILFGDSIIEKAAAVDDGFAMIPTISQKYLRRLDIINRGLSGYTSKEALQILPHVVPSTETAKVRFLIVLFGANDAGFGAPRTGPNPHVPIGQYRRNLVDIISHPAVTAQSPRILLVTPPPIEERLMAERVLQLGLDGMAWTNERTRMYADVVNDVAKEYSIPCLDIFTLLITEAGWVPGEPIPGSASLPINEVMRALVVDGIHLSGQAYRIIEQEIMKLVNETWPDSSPEQLPYALPEWDDPIFWDQCDDA